MPGIIWHERVMHMKNILIQAAGSTPAAGFARAKLREMGMPVTDSPSSQVTHLLLDVPSLDAGGALRGGGDLDSLLKSLPDNVTICGGNLSHTALANFHRLDLLQDPRYLAENAYITAECALDVALPRLTCLLRGCPVLVLGWGRIGKCLARLLKDLGANITVVARKEADRSMLSALGYSVCDMIALPRLLPHFRLIFNTVPHMLLAEDLTALCQDGCVKIDLASQPGLAGSGIITARGLPGLHRPEASGELIARTLVRVIRKEDTL